jgi:hypothetical protein
VNSRSAFFAQFTFGEEVAGCSVSNFHRFKKRKKIYYFLQTNEIFCFMALKDSPMFSKIWFHVAEIGKNISGPSRIRGQRVIGSVELRDHEQLSVVGRQ